MKSIAIALSLTALLGIASTGCSNACDDYQDEVNSCCDKAPAGTTCSITVAEDADSDACQTALDAFKCPY